MSGHQYLSYEEERGIDREFEAHQDRLAQEADEREGQVVRYALVTVTLPDGSHGTVDPEVQFETFLEELADAIGTIVSDGPIEKIDFDLAQVYPDDLVRGGD